MGRICIPLNWQNPNHQWIVAHQPLLEIKSYSNPSESRRFRIVFRMAPLRVLGFYSGAMISCSLYISWLEEKNLQCYTATQDTSEEKNLLINNAPFLKLT